MSGVRAAHIVLLRCSHLVLGSILACCGGKSEDAERDAWVDGGDSSVDRDDASLVDGGNEATVPADVSADIPADVSTDAGNHAADSDGDFPDIDGSDARGPDDRRPDRLDVRISNPDAGPYCPTGGFTNPPACGAALCGNGQIDHCANNFEECDTDDLGVATCEWLGYASGQLRCAPNCELDTSNCDDCVLSEVELACEHPTTAPGVPDVPEIVANGTELGMVWVTSDVNGQGVHFARLLPDLSLISETVCLTDVKSIDGYSAALASTASGWIVASAAAYGGSGNLSVMALDTDGQVRAVRHGPPVYGVVLTEREGGGPLLLYYKNSYVNDAAGSIRELWGELVDDDGNATVPPFRVFDLVDYNVQAVFVDKGFLVAGEHRDALLLARVDLDGTTRVVNTLPPSDGASTLLSNGDEARLVHHDHSQTDGPHRDHWQRVRGDGVFFGAPVPLPDGAYLFSSQGIMVGDRTVLVRDYRSPRLLRLDATGAQILPWVRINRAVTVFGPSMTRLGDEVFAAWVSYNYGYHVTVARLKPF